MMPSDRREKTRWGTDAGRNEHLSPRELRASKTAAQNGLILRKSPIRCGGGDHDDSCRYDLVYERYGQPAATQLKMTAIEIWLGIRRATRH